MFRTILIAFILDLESWLSSVQLKATIGFVASILLSGEKQDALQIRGGNEKKDLQHFNTSQDQTADSKVYYGSSSVLGRKLGDGAAVFSPWKKQLLVFFEIVVLNITPGPWLNFEEARN